MKLAITSFSAGFHAQENVTPLFVDVGGHFVNWHQVRYFDEADAIYCIGWYTSSMQSLQQHLDLLKHGVPVIVHWAGSDVLCCREFGEQMDLTDMWDALNQDHVIHTAGRPALAKEVKELGIKKVTQCHLTSRKIFEPMPFQIKQGGVIDPLVTVYMPPARKEFFNMETVIKVGEKCPDITFILCSFSSNYEQTPILPNMVDWGKLTDTYYAQLVGASNMHLRMVEHDGCSLSVIENCMAGRRVICNQEYPKLPTIPVDVDQIVDCIEDYAYIKLPNKQVAEYYRREFGPEKQREIILTILKEKGVYDGTINRVEETGTGGIKEEVGSAQG
ncbi:MAG: hypothetical protein ACYTBJ_26135 [Planctomycetota bacterium]|jgi:hypothetical protein